MGTVVNKSKKEQSNLKTKEWTFKSSRKFRPKLSHTLQLVNSNSAFRTLLYCWFVCLKVNIT